MKVKRAVWLGFVFCTNAIAVYLVCKAFIPWQRAEFDKFMAIAKVAVPVAVVAGWSLYHELFGRWGGRE